MSFLFKSFEKDCALTERLRNFIYTLHKMKIISSQEFYSLDGDIPYYDSWFYYDDIDDWCYWRSEEDDSDLSNRLETDEETSRDRKIRKRKKHKTQYEKIC